MNHCIPNRKLQPPGAPAHRGVVVTPVVDGEFMFYVYEDDSRPIYRMPAALFGSTAHDRRVLKKSQLIRKERTLAYGDNIYFTLRSESETIICDYELMESKGHSTVTAEDDSGKLLIHTVGVVSPEDPPRLWTKELGIVDFDSDADARDKLYPAAPNIAINCRIEVLINDPGYPAPAELIRKFYDFTIVDPSQRSEVYHADWVRAAPVTTTMLALSSDEDEDEYFIAKEKDTEADLGFMGNKSGIITGQRSVYCHEDKMLKRQNIIIALLNDEADVGCRVNFDVYYSDLLDSYIVFRLEVLSEPLFPMYMENGETTRMEIRLSVRNFDGYFFVHPMLGLISDRLNLLRTLPYAESSRQLGDVAVYAAERGRDRASRFEIVELPTETQKLVEKAEEKMAEKTIIAKGVLINAATGLVFCKQYSCAEFYLQDKDLGRFPLGTILQFESLYNRDVHVHVLQMVNEALPREPPFVGQQNGQEARFKLTVRFHQTYDLLCHPLFGFIDDPQKKLTLSGSRKKDLEMIVRHDDKDPNAQTWLVFEELVGAQTNAGRRAHRAYAGASDDEEYEDPTKHAGVKFCQTERVKERKRNKLRERNFKKRAEGKSVWDPRYQRYDPPKRSAAEPKGFDETFGMGKLDLDE